MHSASDSRSCTSSEDRVGRGCDQSYCILVTDYKLSEETRKRIDIMCDTNDGFRIAEADLKLRGPGDLEGTQQSGMAFDLKIANIARDGQLVQLARTEAQAIIDDDPAMRASSELSPLEPPPGAQENPYQLGSHQLELI